jgi:arginine-tRNA-protein transferase
VGCGGMVSEKHVYAKWLDIQSPCPYLPDRDALMEYAIVDQMTSEEYAEWIDEHWRKMGRVLFRPQCVGCRACQPIRVLVSKFEPRRVHKRIMQMNEHLELRISRSQVSREQVDLMSRYEVSREEAVGWPPSHSPPGNFLRMLVASPLPVMQYCLYEDDRLVAFCIVDELPDGLSAVNSFWEPTLKKRSLGVYTILSLIYEAKRRNLPHLYLGYYVAGCRSMQYKAQYYPSEILTADGGWQPFKS